MRLRGDDLVINERKNSPSGSRLWGKEELALGVRSEALFNHGSGLRRRECGRGINLHKRGGEHMAAAWRVCPAGQQQQRQQQQAGAAAVYLQ